MTFLIGLVFEILILLFPSNIQIHYFHKSLFFIFRKKQILPQTENINYKSNDRLKRRLLVIAKIITSILIIYFLINFIEFDKIRTALKKADVLLILFAVLLLPLNIFWQFKKWKFVCNSIVSVQNNRSILLSLFYGISGGLFTPLQAGEYVTRAIPLKECSILKVAFATAVDKFYPLVIIFLVGSILMLPFLHYYFNISGIMTILGIVAIVFVFVLIYMILFGKKTFEITFINKLNRFKFLKAIGNELKELRKLDAIFSFKMFGFSSLLILTYSLQFVLIISAFTHQVHFVNYLWFVVIVLFAKTILPPVTFGEIGIREAASVYFGSYFGIAEAAAFNAAMVLFFINLIIPSLIGLTLFMVKAK